MLLGLLAIPWLAADLGFSVDQIPVLNRVFITDAVRVDPGGPTAFSAVHDGHHHGMAGVLLAWSALLLTRVLPDIASRRLRVILAPYAALLLVFGLVNALQDFVAEQLFKRGVIAWQLPRFTKISADPKWLGAPGDCGRYLRRDAASGRSTGPRSVSQSPVTAAPPPASTNSRPVHAPPIFARSPMGAFASPRCGRAIPTHRRQ